MSARLVVRGRDLDRALGNTVEVSGTDVQRLREMFPGTPLEQAIAGGIEALYASWCETKARPDLFTLPSVLAALGRDDL